ncbi:aminotransferase class V-fold PLP-dependent enzyme [Desulfotomaculum copahuensis]|uniref:cysteine desulfurase n=1 Tax=Desulfotomaculum copahuensis TaxID=1838280 RepID=A0A1B7LEP6_9FIRM|nr:aminotransferase class V-fold PLP-dependent enzyme [Desulfotomaculum copahuensis]OAT81754.1 cysteine desulfurase [Desulfotomaculum copahuensis]
MVYLDNAATSWPKPPEVLAAMERCLREVGANPGRAGHKMAIAANRLVDETRKELASLFNIGNPDRIVFGLNATEALNLALKGLLGPGDHVVTSSMEHNSVTRPLNTLRGAGVKVTKVACDHTGAIRVADVAAAVRRNTRAIVLTHASNVTGTVMPVAEIGRLARDRDLVFIVDAAQTAGVLDIDVTNMHIHLLAFPGHKGLYGPPGTGGLYVAEGVELNPLKEGGTGSHSDLPGQPEILPERYESGTLNTAGLAGLGEGVKFICREGIEKIRRHEQELTRQFLEGVKSIKDIRVYGPCDASRQAPVVSFAVGERPAGDIGAILDQNYNIACRAGLHCAPDAHRTLGTFEQKLVRFSFSRFNQPGEVEYALYCLREIVEKNIPAPAGGGCGC